MLPARTWVRPNTVTELVPVRYAVVSKALDSFQAPTTTPASFYPPTIPVLIQVASDPAPNQRSRLHDRSSAYAPCTHRPAAAAPRGAPSQRDAIGAANLRSRHPSRARLGFQTPKRHARQFDLQQVVIKFANAVSVWIWQSNNIPFALIAHREHTACAPPPRTRGTIRGFGAIPWIPESDLEIDSTATR